MNDAEYPNIEELLSSFIDGELTDRQRTEIERLIAHGAKLAKRLRELQKCKMLVGSLPHAQAPVEMLDEIKERTLLTRRAEHLSGWAGTAHLLARKVVAAAAMIGLIAILGAVIFSIVTPESGPPAAGFTGRLELKTTNLIAADAFVKKAIKDKGLSDSISLKRQGDKSVYSLHCSREDLNLLLADLEDIWGQFSSTALFVKMPREQKFDGVSTEQIIEIVEDLTIPPKPRLTEPEEVVEKSPTPAQVHLTIVVVGTPTDN